MWSRKGVPNVVKKFPCLRINVSVWVDLRTTPFWWGQKVLKPEAFQHRVLEWSSDKKNCFINADSGVGSALLRLYSGSQLLGIIPQTQPAGLDGASDCLLVFIHPSLHVPLTSGTPQLRSSPSRNLLTRRRASQSTSADIGGSAAGSAGATSCVAAAGSSCSSGAAASSSAPAGFFCTAFTMGASCVGS